MTHQFLSHAALDTLVADLVAGGVRVIAPVRAKDNPDLLDYLPILKLADAAIGVGLQRRSIKEFFLPPTEVLLSYKQSKNGFEITEVPTIAPRQVIFGASPCDAAGVDVVDKVMDWDLRDELWFGRREATTIVTFLCSIMDSGCFCNAVGLGPDSSRGSDVLLVPVEGGYLADVLTPKGEALLAGLAEGADASEITEACQASADAARLEANQKLDSHALTIPAEFDTWLAENFDHPIWKTMAQRCHGCGACAGVCPTCHCFDIVDEHDSAESGVRRRNWDSCQTARFTLHASGHNPRQSQTERFRQRIQHKFSIYPIRFGDILCTGCGRCSRTCPGDMDLPEILGELIALTNAVPEKSDQ